ncbi:D-amino-acid transaminase [Virgibacillus profundi]|uniref:D-alanine aminotransferase n=1 Tax=Virgibacillus profundi TaxID=2024555 RepID=A0A2A2IGT5_9BACI|nr:D-amino-acid transaminase [Virgibacillus profundi]PAV30857.1 D-amino-acid transaminase [Virgibacillus profundi]PXY55040.1 D-amino-acid transaminase [Virgibacillus profundi]
MTKMLFNDQIMERGNLIDIEDRGYQFGDGIYEVIGVYDGKPLMMDEHLERLERSAREVQLKLPDSISVLKRNLEELVAANQLNEGIIYMQVSRGAAQRWHEFPGLDVTPVTVAYTREEERMTEVENQGANAVLTEDIRWLRCDIKTLNLLPNVMAKQKAVENNAVEAILHRGDTVTEASASNVFIVKDGELYTHPANNFILNGITRRKIIQLCDELNIKVNEETFTVNELLSADEVFVTATKSDIIPILKIDDQTIGTGSPGDITKKVLQEFRSLYQHGVKNKA